MGYNIVHPFIGFVVAEGGSSKVPAMGKAERWLRSILAGKKGGGRRGDKRGQSRCDSTPLAELPVATSPREKRRWSFRRPAPLVKTAAAPSPLAVEPGGLSVAVAVSERELEQSKHAVAEAAAARIQATFRGYLARKALCALRGLVKLQALIRGHLVRKEDRATLRRMQALLMAQTRVRAQRMRMLEDEDHAAAAPVDRRSPQHPRRRRSYEMDKSGEEHAKIVEMDMGEPPRRGRSSCSVAASEPWSREGQRADYYGPGQCLPAPSSAFIEITSPRATAAASRTSSRRRRIRADGSHARGKGEI
uniref:DUF4005 domain-containing protein n=1 Tax=Hordeum vulgare subsp. vulgare TaxID=112509 RepID=A0A8I6YNV2_HORVV